VFELIDVAFAQRRKTSRNAFAEWAGSGNESARRLLAASIDPSRRGETLSVADFVRLLERSGERESTPNEPQAQTSEAQTQEPNAPTEEHQVRVV
jgi:16S rRNA (adenine1518-N6/adenine1519-N6)-dimethyltransferase